jgi:SAM-dependent methyltransferase
MASRYDDEIWELVPDPAPAPPAHLVGFVRSLPRAEAALDLGCGDGRLTAELRAGRLTAADVSAVALARAGARLDGAELRELDPDAPLPFADASFDLVLCAETIEHVRDVQLLVSEARRVLRPGGELALTTPAHGRLTGVAIALRGLGDEFDPRSPHLRFLSRRSLRALLADGGFDLRSLRRRRGTLLARATR